MFKISYVNKYEVDPLAFLLCDDRAGLSRSDSAFLLAVNLFWE